MKLSIKYSHTSITEEVLLPANLIKGLSPPNGMTSLGKQDLRGAEGGGMEEGANGPNWAERADHRRIPPPSGEECC